MSYTIEEANIRTHKRNTSGRSQVGSIGVNSKLWHADALIIDGSLWLRIVSSILIIAIKYLTDYYRVSQS